MKPTPSADSSLQVSILSPLSPEECVKRVKTGISNEWSGWADGPNMLAARPLSGVMTTRRLTLYKRSTSRNSFTPTFIATVHPQEGGGTLIKGYFAMHPITSRFIMFLSALPAFGTVALLVGAVLALLSGSVQSGILMLLSTFIPLIMTVAGVSVAKSTLSPETGEAIFLRDYLWEKLDADLQSNSLPPQFSPCSPPPG